MGSQYQTNVDFRTQGFPISVCWLSHIRVLNNTLISRLMLTSLHKGSKYQTNVDFPIQGFPSETTADFSAQGFPISRLLSIFLYTCTRTFLTYFLTPNKQNLNYTLLSQRSLATIIILVFLHYDCQQASWHVIALVTNL